LSPVLSGSHDMRKRVVKSNDLHYGVPPALSA
jgi:hypothetical protein